MGTSRVVIFAGGDCRDLNFYRRLIGPRDRIVCADGGSRHVLAMGLSPFAVVGDLDSVDRALEEKLKQLPLEWICNPSLDQEQSDLEMALAYALSLEPAELLICGALGGERVDHLLANLHLLLIPLQAGVEARIVDEGQTIGLLDREMIISGRPGDYLSLLSLTLKTTGITTQGLKYPLHGGTLNFGSTRGLSNELISPSARVAASSGLLLVVHTPRR